MNNRRFIVMSSRHGQTIPDILVDRAHGLGYSAFYRSDALAILTVPDAPITPFDRTRGLIVGYVLGGASSLPESGDLQHDGEFFGDHLIRTIWGGYAAIWRTDTGDNAWIMADPSGALPVYYCDASSGLMIAGTAPRDLEHIRGDQFTVDWATIKLYLQCPYYRSSRTMLSGVQELLPGHSLSLASGETRSIWSPWRFADPDRFVTNFDTAVELVRDSITRAVYGWTKPFDRILLNLSGGLDSSIVAASIARAGHPQTTCLTISSGVSTGNESAFASAVADCCDLPLIEDVLDARDINLDESFAAHCPRPLGRAFSQSVDAISMRHGRALGANAFFGGGGGDNVFCYLTSVAPVLDHIIAGRNWRGSWAALRNVCAVTGADVGTAARLVARRFAARRFNFSLGIDTSFLRISPNDPNVAIDTHPWLKPPPDILPGSAAHVALILSIYNYLEGARRELEAPCIAPLMSQPVIEACLSIPTWLWITGGRNRSVARAAFADLLPPPITNRVSKGTPDGFSIRFMENNRRSILERILEGPLAQHDILDRDAIEMALGRDGPERDLNHSRLLSFCEINAWIASWER